MDTNETVQLREQERQALCMLVQSQWQLIMVRGQQVAAEREHAEMYARGERAIEARSEQQEVEIETLRAEAKACSEAASADKMDLLGFQRWTPDLVAYVRTARIDDGRPEPTNPEHAFRILASAHHSQKAALINFQARASEDAETIREQQMKIADLQQQLGSANAGRYSRLVQLCLDGLRSETEAPEGTRLYTLEAELAIAAESDLLLGEMPF
jgi:hypothetical protein